MTIGASYEASSFEGERFGRDFIGFDCIITSTNSSKSLLIFGAIAWSALQN